MEWLTHEADFGLEDWEETLFFVKSDPNGAYNIIDIAKYQGEPEFDEILKNIALRLAAYENTDLEPEDILRILDAYGRGMTLRTESAQRLEIVKGIQTDRLRELAQADREGRCVVLDDITVREIPAADVAPVRHGRWIKPVPGDGEPYCSECHVEQPWFYGYGYYHRDYCPNCGALMDGKEADREV